MNTKKGPAVNKYISIDIETSALEPEEGQMLEFGAVLDCDLNIPVGDLPSFRRLILPRNGVIRGTPFALAMNAEILREIDAELKNPSPDRSCTAAELPSVFRDWLDVERPVIGGKNFATFDSKFLRAESNFFKTVAPHHRVLDPGNMYWRPAEDGFELPDTATCMKRAGLDPTVKHRAVEDARVVCRLIRTHVYCSVTAGKLAKSLEG